LGEFEVLKYLPSFPYWGEGKRGKKRGDPREKEFVDGEMMNGVSRGGG